MRHAGHDAPQRVSARPRLFDALDHLLGRLFIRTAGDLGFDLLARDVERIDLGLHRVDLTHEAHDPLDPGLEPQHVARDRAGRHPAHRLSRARASTPLPVADAVFRLVCVVGVGRSVHVSQMLVGLRARVLVAHQNQDGSPQRLAFQYPREDLRPVFLLPGARYPALAGPASIQLELDVVYAEWDTGRAAVHNDAHAPAVRLAPGMDAKEMSEARAHGAIIGCRVGRGDRPVIGAAHRWLRSPRPWATRWCRPARADAPGPEPASAAGWI